MKRTWCFTVPRMKRSFETSDVAEGGGWGEAGGALGGGLSKAGGALGGVFGSGLELLGPNAIPLHLPPEGRSADPELVGGLGG